MSVPVNIYDLQSAVLMLIYSSSAFKPASCPHSLRSANLMQEVSYKLNAISTFHLGDPCVDGKTILKWLLKKLCMSNCQIYGPAHVMFCSVKMIPIVSLHILSVNMVSFPIEGPR
jgi:hypothetical protein